MRKILSTILFLLASSTSIAMGDTPTSNKTDVKLTSGHDEQTVKAGETIEHIVFSIANVNSVEPDLLPGLECNCTGVPGASATCTVSGRIPATASGKTYIMKLDVHGTQPEDNVSTQIKVTVIPMASPLEYISGSLNQTVTAGDSIEPIAYRYKSLYRISISGQPKGIKAVYDESTWTISIIGAPDESYPDQDFNYKLVVYSTEKDSVVVNGELHVKHKPAVTTLKVIENATQNVTAGNAIKPIVFSFANMNDVEVKGIPQNFTPDRNNEKKTLTISGTIPESHGDKVYTISVIAKGLDNNDTATATISVVHKPIVTKLELQSNNASQTVKAGSPIEPVIFKGDGVLRLEPSGLPKGTFMTSQDSTNKTLKLTGTVDDLDAGGTYKVKLIAKGIDNNDTTYITITVQPQAATVELINGKDAQTKNIGDSIESIIFKYSYVKGITIIGNIPEGITYKQDQDKHTITFSGKINESNNAGEYIFGLSVEGNNSADSAKTKVIVKSKSEPSSSSIASSSSSAKSSSSKEIATSSSSSSKVASSSSKTPSSSSSAKATSSSSNKASSSSSAKSSSSKGTKIEQVLRDAFKFSYSNNELTATLANAAPTQVQIFDLTGHLIETYELETSASINLGHLPRGTVLLRISSKNFIKTTRIAIK